MSDKQNEAPKSDVKVIPAPDEDLNKITYNDEPLGGLPIEVIKFGEHEISAKLLAEIAENMRVTLLELGYVIALSRRIEQEKPDEANTTTATEQSA